MNEIPVYKAEAELRDEIITNRSIAYCQPASKMSDGIKAFAEQMMADKIKDYKAIGFKMDKDLYYHQSILVSTTWNKNDDVFFPEHVWAARHTPEDKPTNLEHDQALIVGHITGNWAIDEENQLIADETAVDELPEIFHILNSSVIYTVRDNKDDQKRVNDLIFQIEAGEMYVSMECLFSDFDYIVKKPDGDLPWLR